MGLIRARASGRFSTRSKHSGCLHSRELWGDAFKQVKLGWLGAPLPIDIAGNVLTYAHGSNNIAFRFGAGHADELRAFGDLKNNHVNLYCSVWAPIKLPTWGHITQMCLGNKSGHREWSFFKADREDAYKQLPMGPMRRNLGMVSFRNPVAGEWVAFPPKELLFGEVSEALHYNCFARLLSVLFSRIFGIPLIGYFDGPGALVPSKPAPIALRTSERFCEILFILRKVAKPNVQTPRYSSASDETARIPRTGRTDTLDYQDPCLSLGLP